MEIPVPVERRLAGVVGAVRSGRVVTVSGALAAEVLPEGSIAWTR